MADTTINIAFTIPEDEWTPELIKAFKDVIGVPQSTGDTVEALKPEFANTMCRYMRQQLRNALRINSTADVTITHDG